MDRSLLREWLVVGGLLVGSAGAVQWSRAFVAKQHEKSSTLEQTYALPSSEHLKVFSLGYRSAVADLLFGRTLVAAGMHFSAHKVFDHLDGYLNAIVDLEPRYRDVYYYADSLLTLSTVRMPGENYRKARELQARGMKLFPDDAQLWISAGQFMTYVAVQWLPPGEDPNEWRRAGVRVIEHACEIWPFAELPASCLGAASMLSKLGETEASIRSLERLIAVSDDQQVRSEATLRLEALMGEHAKEQYRQRASQLAELHEADLPQTNRTEYQLMGPATEPRECVGEREPGRNQVCASSFAMMGPARRAR